MAYSKCPACGYHAFNGEECFDCGYRSGGPRGHRDFRFVGNCITVMVVLATAITVTAVTGGVLGLIVGGVATLVHEAVEPGILVCAGAGFGGFMGLLFGGLLLAATA